MKRMILLAILAVACSAGAQPAQKKEAAKPEAAPAAAEAPKPAAEPAKPQAQKPATMARKHQRRSGDARHCLERPNNTEIIKCAEAYL